MKIVYTLFLIHVSFYWSAVLFYIYFYKQNTKNWFQVTKQVLFNQFFFTPIYIIPYEYYPTPLSTYHIFWQLPLIIVLTDIIFYTSHRYFHYNKLLYNNIHRKHHEYDPPIAIGALHAHPIEHIFVNLFSTIMPMFIVRSDMIVSIIWTIISSVNVVVAHSGTWPNDPHIAHHRYLKCNYGVGLLLMDKVLGTFKFSPIIQKTSL